MDSDLMAFFQNATAVALLDGPFESGAEADFARDLFKYIDQEVKVATQVEVKTSHALFRADFLLLVRGLRFVVEIDGAEFHTDINRDCARDALLLATGKIHQVVRIKARGVCFHSSDVLFLLGGMFPGLMSAAGEINLQRLASRQALEHRCTADSDRVTVYYPVPKYDPDFLEVEDTGEESEEGVSHNRHYPTMCGVEMFRRRPGYWKDFVEYAQPRSRVSLDVLVPEYLAFRANRWVPK